MLLADHFLKKYRNEVSRKISGFNQEAISTMLSYDWPGNVRELESKVRRGIVLTNGRLLSSADMGFDKQLERQEELPLREIRDQAEKRAMVLCLTRTMGNISQAAKILKVSRPTLHDLLRKYQINTQDFKNAHKK